MAFEVVGLYTYGTNNQGEIPALWQAFIPRIGDIQDRARPGVTLGVCDHVDHFDAQVTAFGYLAGVEVKDGAKIPEGMEKIQVASQTYLVFTHVGSTGDLEETYQYIYGSYLFQSKAVLVDAPDFEWYDHRFDGGVGQSELDIYIPIAGLDSVDFDRVDGE